MDAQLGRDKEGYSPLIAHVIFRLDVGGLENGLVNLINRTPPGICRHAIICLTHATEFKNRIEVDGVSIIELDKRSGKDLPVYFRFWQALRQLKPDIVHTRNFNTIEFQALAIQFPKDKQAAEGWYKAGECSRLTNSRQEAVKSFETIRLLYPQSPFAAKGLYEAGMIYLEDGEYSKAYRDFSIVLDRFRNSPVYFASQVSAGHCLLKQNDIEKAKIFAGLVLGSQAESAVKADALLLMAMINETQGYNSDAQRNYDRIIQEHKTQDRV